MNEKTKMDEIRKDQIENTYVILISIVVFILYLSIHLSVFIFRIPYNCPTTIIICFLAGIALFLCIVSLILAIFAIKEKWYINCSIIMIILSIMRAFPLF